MNRNKFTKRFIIGTIVSLYVIVSLISGLHVIDFFKMSNPYWLAVSLAIAFEIGAAASLSAIIILDKTNKGLVWGLFILLTAMQIQGNIFYAYTHLTDFKDWVDLFGLSEEDPVTQKKILSIVSGAILPIIALGFIKSLVDYIRPDDGTNEIKESTEIKSIDSSIETGADQPEQLTTETNENVKQTKYEYTQSELSNFLPIIDGVTGNVKSVKTEPKSHKKRHDHEKL